MWYLYCSQFQPFTSTAAWTAAQCGADNDVPSPSPPDVPASSAGLGASQAEEVPSDMWSLPPPVHGATFWPDAYLYGLRVGEIHQRSLELQFTMHMLEVWRKRYETTSPTCSCDAALSAEYIRGFQMGCQERKAFLNEMVKSELFLLGYRLQLHMSKYTC